MDLTTQKISDFHREIFSWWTSHRRDLPWRHTHDPYKILVSEVMLQQTQVSRALPKYHEFLQVFPTIQELSDSPLSAVLLVWKGMGYNRRAQYLQKTAREIVNKYTGHFPTDEKQLLLLPGIGLYTARAIQVFAWKKDVAMVDTNIRQIITQYFFKGVDQPAKVIQQTADTLIPIGKSWEWHQALMDYGAIAIPNSRDVKRKDQSVVTKKKIPFRDSPRFIRGKIIDILREGPSREDEIIQKISQLANKPKDFIVTAFNSLLKDQLIERLDPGHIQLSEK